MTDSKNYPPPRHGISPEVWHTFCAISDPANRHIFTKEAAYKAFQHVRIDGGREMLQELSAAARKLHDEGVIPQDVLSTLIGLSATVPMTDAQVKEIVAKRYPAMGNTSLGGVPLRVATAEAVKALRQQEFEQGKRERPDAEAGEDS